jgi:hypothetical protein
VLFALRDRGIKAAREMDAAKRARKSANENADPAPDKLDA